MLALYYLLLSTENATAYGSNLVPFKEMTRYSMGSRGFFYNVMGNIALFIPFGFFVSYYIKANKTHQIVLISIITSLTAELIQFKIGRAFDIDDIILNTIGAIIGFLAYLGIKIIKDKLPKKLQSNVFYNILAIFILIIIILVFYFMWGNR
jgi:glycopeptide antibiotics resistance protein